MHVYLIAFQIAGSVVIYYLLRPISEILAQGVMICVMAPTATAAPVIAGILGGNIASLTAYSLISNFSVAVFAPLFFSFAGYNDLPFTISFLQIAEKVGILLIVPFIIALVINKLLPKIGLLVKNYSSISFYLWSVALVIVTGRTVQFIKMQGTEQLTVEIAMAVFALMVCLIQFLGGRAIGKKFNDTVSGGQGLGQKNTILAIWMAQTFLNPLSSIAPGAYVLWQNAFNSWQVWKRRKIY
jgi:BASS family bile acid:Na+ symporter